MTFHSPRRAGNFPRNGVCILLVLSRGKDEVIMIGDIKVTVVDIRGDKVRIGIEAPIEVPVHRAEVYRAIQDQKRFQREHKPSCGDVNAGDQPND